MNREQFYQFVRQVEGEFSGRPSALRVRTALWAATGYAGLLGGLICVLGMAGAFLVPAIRMKAEDAWLLYIVGGLILVGGGWAVGRALWVRLPLPEGRPIARREAPALFVVIDGLRGQLRSPSFHRVLIVGEVNAGVRQAPRLGVFGWPRNYLLLGLPLMDLLSADEFRAVLAHE